MHLASFSTLACLVAAVAAQTSSNANPFKIPSAGYALTAGKPSIINWTPTTSGPITLTLRSGASSDLNKGTVIASSVPNSGSFTYTPPANTVRNSDYTVEISSDSDPSAVNYTPQFVIESTNTVESASAASSASATSASAASASSGASSMSSMSMSMSASSASASASSASASGSSAMASSSMGGSSTSGSATGSATGSTAPTSGASLKDKFVVQGGLAAMVIGAVAVL